MSDRGTLERLLIKAYEKPDYSGSAIDEFEASDTELLVSKDSLLPGDRDQVDALLESVVEHWRVLEHTSIAGLRGSFLQRPGLLAEVDLVWQLRVEPHAFDVLVDQLPWSISTVKLPWMTTRLFTEWTTP